MRPTLDPAAPVLRRGAQHLQIGTDPDDAVVLRDLPGVRALLRRCDGVREREAVLAGAGMSPDADAVLAALLDAGALIDADARDRAGRASGEAARLVGLGVPGSVAPTAVEARLRRPVAVLGPAIVAEPLLRLLRDCGAQAGPQSEAGSRAELAVVVGHPEPARERLDTLTRDDVDHLVGALHPRSVVLGPLVRPGRTACVRCADAARADRDPAWAALVPQLDSPPQRPVAAAAGSPLLLATLVAATAAVVLAWLDGTPTAVDGSVLRWGADGVTPTATPLSPHPRCGCQHLR